MVPSGKIDPATGKITNFAIPAKGSTVEVTYKQNYFRFQHKNLHIKRGSVREFSHTGIRFTQFRD